MNQFRIVSLTGISVVDMESILAPMVKESEAEGFRHIRRLYEDYISGANRFDKISEALVGIRDGDRLIAIGGVNATDIQEIGRIRRVYVSPERRRQGVGRLLMEEIMSAARPHYRRLVLRTHNPAAAAFYLQLGFVPVASNPEVTHFYDFPTYETEMSQTFPISSGIQTAQMRV
jgi:GNAT superfamily N-acetyltransferase